MAYVLLTCDYRFALASHFLWGLWSIVQAKISSIEFGYMVCFRGNSPNCKEELLCVSLIWAFGDLVAGAV